MERRILSQEEIINARIKRSFQMQESAAKLQNGLGSPVSQEMADMFSASGIQMLESTLAEAEECGIKLPTDVIESSRKLIEEKGAWANQVMDKVARSWGMIWGSPPPSSN